MLYLVLVDGMFVTGNSQMVKGAHVPVLEESDMKYAKLFQTRNGAVACYNKIMKIWPERIVEVHSAKVQLTGLVKTNEE